MSRPLRIVITAASLLLLSACSHLSPPRGLAAGEVYWCCPGSAVPRRVQLADSLDLPGLRIGAQRRSRCGTF